MTKENPHRRSVSELDELLATGDVPAFVAKCERHHAERLARIAELIATRIPAVRLVLEAGPSAAGKTTSAIRLCRALEANGLTGGSGREALYTSGSLQDFEKKAEHFLHRPVKAHYGSAGE